MALWGLLFNLLYIYTGNRTRIVPLGVAHGAIYACFTYLLAWLRPIDLHVGTWTVRLVNERTLEGPAAMLAFGTLLGPVIPAAIAYGSLYFRARDRTSRYRIDGRRSLPGSGRPRATMPRRSRCREALRIKRSGRRTRS